MLIYQASTFGNIFLKLIPYHNLNIPTKETPKLNTLASGTHKYKASPIVYYNVYTNLIPRTMYIPNEYKGWAALGVVEVEYIADHQIAPVAANGLRYKLLGFSYL